MKNKISEKTGKPYSGTTVNKLVTLGRRVYFLAMDQGHGTDQPICQAWRV